MSEKSAQNCVLVGIVMGSRSDELYLEPTTKALTDLGIPYEISAFSAHRTPHKVEEYGSEAQSRGLEVIIAAAGGAAALPGALAAWTELPVIGIPLPSSELKGVDALYAIAQMPPGVPVACVAVGSWGARNAAYLAASILALHHEDIANSYRTFREAQRQG
jgi:5-(carboxyamino)imidazole ribonucleotide mutase